MKTHPSTRGLAIATNRNAKYDALVKAAHKASRILHTVDSDEAQDLANELETIINQR